MVREDRPNDKRIIAYIVAEEGNDSSCRNSFLCFRKFSELYDASSICIARRITINAKWKVDRKKLPAPDYNGMNNERVARNRKKKYYVIYLQKYLVFLALALMIISSKWEDIRFLHLV